MNYEELIAKATKGKKVSELSREWGVNEMTLGRYVRGKRLPDYTTARVIAKAAGVSLGDVLETLANEEQMQKSRQFKLQTGFVQTQLVALLAIASIAASLYIM